MYRTYLKHLISLSIIVLAIPMHAQALRSVNIQIAQDSIDELESHPYTNEDVHGNFVVGSERFDAVEIHYRGAYYLHTLIRDGSLRNWKIKTQKSQKLEDRREWNFNYENYIRQNLAYHLFRDAGVSCVSSENVMLSVNGQEQGLYLKYEDPDNKDWLEDTFGDDEGDLYKAAYDMPDEEKFFADLTYLGANDEDYFLHYRKQTNKKGENEFDYSSIREFTSLINHSTDEEFEALIAQRFDVQGFIRYLVVANFMANWDSYPFRPKNFFLYNNPADQKWHFIPWDLDGTFQEVGGRNPIGTTGSVFHYFDGIDDYKSAPTEPLERPLVWRIMSVERFRNHYIYEYQQAVATYLSEGSISAVIDSIEAGVNVSASRQDYSAYADDVSSVRDFIAKRHPIVSDEISAFDVEPPLAIDESGAEGNFSFTLYPNPAKDRVFISLPHITGESLTIHNLYGEAVCPAIVVANSQKRIQEIDISHLPSGIFVVTVMTKGFSYSSKLHVMD